MHKNHPGILLAESNSVVLRVRHEALHFFSSQVKPTLLGHEHTLSRKAIDSVRSFKNERESKIMQQEKEERRTSLVISDLRIHFAKG